MSDWFGHFPKSLSVHALKKPASKCINVAGDTSASSSPVEFVVLVMFVVG
jgi:hypothetical protein